MKLSAQESQDAVEAVRRAFAARNAPDWLAPSQDRALEAFTRHGFPTLRHEDWKYTNVARLARSSAEMLTACPKPPDLDTIESVLAELPIAPDEPRIVVANGRFEAALSKLPDPDSGLRVAPLTDWDGPDQKRITARLAEDTRFDAYAFAALNAAFFSDGLIVDIAAERMVGPALHVVHVTDGQGLLTQPRIFVKAGRHSSARMFEHHVGTGPGWTNAVTEIDCADGARLGYVKLQAEAAATDHVSAQFVSLAEHSRFDALHLDLGGRLARNDLRVRVAGSGSHADLRGVFVADAGRHVDNHTHTDHIAAHGTSREQYRGILSGDGRGVFNGKIVVHEGADGTDAQLNNRNLLLSKTAEIDTKPELEIYTDDVKCAHGATTGQLDEHALFYLRARGVSRQLARHMLVLAFAQEILEKFDPATAELSEYVGNHLERRLPE